MGLTGSVEACAAAAKQFRVYYHKTGDEDYLVDHSIISYLLGAPSSGRIAPLAEVQGRQPLAVSWQRPRRTLAA